MSFSIIPNWVIRNTDLTAHELLVYLALLNRVDRFGNAWPSMKLLTRESRASERTVKRALASLGERGIVRVTRRPQANGPHLPNIYRLKVFDRQPPMGGVQTAAPRGAHSPYEGRIQQDEVEPLEVEPREVDLRSFAGRTTTGVHFEEGDLASVAQQQYLRDLIIHGTGEPPTPADELWLSSLTSWAATSEIGERLRDMPRYQDYEGPERLSPEYEALSSEGQAWSDRGMLPDPKPSGAS